MLACSLLIGGCRLSTRTPTIVARVDSVESTPNPSAFLLRLDSKIEGVLDDGLRGTTFRRGRDCPNSIDAIFAASEGVESIFAMGDLLTLSKKPSTGWDAVLPPVIEALGGASPKLEASGLPLSDSDGSDASAGGRGAVTIRLQVSQKLPIQIEAAGWSGACDPVRAKLSPRFASAMGMLIGGEKGDAFFAGRTWLDRGVRYPLDGDHDSLLGNHDVDDGDELGVERLAIASALDEEAAEVEAAYPDERLQAIVFKQEKAATPPKPAADALLSLAEVDELCDEDAASEADGGSPEALQRLAAFAATGSGVLGARRNAVAYLGGTGGRGGDAVFDAIAKAFKQEQAAGLRRTAGDALSDLGDPRAERVAVSGLADRSSLVRWRAARILGELGDGSATLAALKQASLEEKAFEVAFELRDAARKVKGRLGGEGGPRQGPMWKQIQDGLQGDGGDAP